LKIMAAACTDGTFFIVIPLTPSPRWPTSAARQREERAMLKTPRASCDF